MRMLVGRFSRGLAFGALALALAQAPARAETLADALIAAYRNSNLLDQNRALLRAADEDVASAVAALRPVVSFIAQSSYTEPSMADNLSASVSLSAEMTLYDFGRSRMAVDIAKETVLATREGLVGVEQGVLLTAVRAFMDVRSAVESVAINRNSVRVIGEELRAAEDRFSVGEVTRTDVALAEARLAAARAGLAAAEGELAAAREAYRAATGRYPGTLAAPPSPPALPATLDAARSIAQTTHPSIAQARHQVTVAELQVVQAAAQRGPTLSGSASLSVDDEGNDQSRIGLTLSQPIYRGGGLSAAHRKAIAGRDAARSGLLEAGVGIAQQVGDAWAQIAVARAQIMAVDRQVEAATVAYNGVKEEAALGSRTTLDVLDAEQELLDAQASRIDAEANLQVAIYSLLSAMGLLTADHLKLGIATYDPRAYYDAVKSAPLTSVQGERLDRVLRAIGKE